MKCLDALPVVLVAFCSLGVMPATSGASGATAPAATAAGAACKEGPSPRTMEGWVKAGDCLREAGRYQEAVDCYRVGLSGHPTGSLDLYLGMAMAYSELEDWIEMQDAAESALRIDGENLEARYQLGIAYEQQAEFPLAIEAFEKVVTVRPNDNRALRNIGFVLLQEGKPEAAIKPLETAVSVDPHDWKAHVNLSSAYSETFQALREELLRRSTSGPHVVTPRQTELLERLRTTNYHAMAIDQAREAVKANPDVWNTWYILGTTLREDSASLPEAIDAMQHVDKIRPNELDVLRQLAWAQQRAGRYSDAFETCKRMAPLVRNDVWLERVMGELSVELHDDTGAEKHYRAALALDPSDWNVRVSLARALRRMGRSQDAEQEIATAKQVRPEMTSVIDGYYKHP